MKIALAQSPNATCFPAGPLISEVYLPSLRIDIKVHQPVKNPISDKSNILWNSPSLG